MAQPLEAYKGEGGPKPSEYKPIGILTGKTVSFVENGQSYDIKVAMQPPESEACIHVLLEMLGVEIPEELRDPSKPLEVSHLQTLVGAVELEDEAFEPTYPFEGPHLVQVVRNANPDGTHLVMRLLQKVIDPLTGTTYDAKVYEEQEVLWPLRVLRVGKHRLQPTSTPQAVSLY